MQTLLEQIDQGQQWTFPGGIHPPDRKTLSNGTPIATLPLPERFWVPVRQHIGQAARLTVASGDQVLKGQALTAPEHPMAVPVHAPTSGTIGRIESRPSAHPSGLPELTIEVIADGEDHWRPRETRVSVEGLDRDAILARVRDAGIAGLGGAAFPAAIKLASDKPVRFLIINGAECEPYITADDRLMQDKAEEILRGIEVLDHLLGPERILFAIEDNKPAAIAAVKEAIAASHLSDEHILLRVIPTKYPSGSEKQLVQIVTGLEVPQGKLPKDLGVLMHNVGTCYAIKRALLDDEPLIERVVTLTGEQAGKPGNYWVRLGTEIQWLLDSAGCQPQPDQPLIMGGPMMGFALPSTRVPVVKATNCLLMPSRNELPPAPAPRNCIRCGECAQVCPQSLLPQQLYWHSQAGEFDKAAQLNLADCIECGACAFVCPSDLPLVHHYRIAKAELRDAAQKAAKADAAKLRFDARQARLEREKAERENRHKRAAKPAPAATSAGVADALARIKAKKASTETESGEVDMAELRRQRKAEARAAKAARESAGDSAVEAPQASDTAPPTDPKKAAVAAALARAKAKKAAQQATEAAPSDAPTEEVADPRKAAVAAALARAKAKKAAQQAPEATPSEAPAQEGSDPRKAAVAAAVARAKAKKAAEQASEAAPSDAPAEETDPRKAAVAAAVARAKAKKAAQQAPEAAPSDAPTEEVADPRKAAVAAAVARAKAKKAAQQASDAAPSDAPAEQTDPRKAAVAAAVARAKAKKAAQQASDAASSPEPAEPSEDPDAKRKAAVAAAIAKAKARQKQNNEQ
ncbi:electron transport complex subunit RsxC [Ferrimonas balearica]|uniref:electron transport complex subunit RsxC n=1 Tax=Ferrimonas balearica TaxID=44012 RepID=UPI001C99E043|nr:electron transport complex subunit RsxC [Ferrimonas balearica]MBY5991916.1 electron transport complex subunit RsxC [Ferrimonas balearica]